MNIYLEITNYETNKNISINMMLVQEFGTEDTTDDTGAAVYLIYYKMNNGIFYREAFDTTDAREARLAELEDYMI